jgi:protease-4
MDQFGFVEAIDKLGVERRSITSGENKAFLDPFLPLEQKQVVHARDMLEQIHKQFIDVVKKGRGNRLKDSPELFSGLFWTGEKSIELGLADAYGSLDTVARDVIKAEAIVDYTQKENLAERLAKRFGAAAVRAMGIEAGGWSLR